MPSLHAIAAAVAYVDGCVAVCSYEAMKHRYCVTQRKASVDGPASIVLGAIAGGTAAGITTPLDTAKTRLMTQTTTAKAAAAGAAATAASATAATGPAGAAGAAAAAAVARPYTGVWDVLSRIASEEGPRALFRGVVPRVMWISVGGGIFFGTYEKAVKLLAPAGYTPPQR